MLSVTTTNEGLFDEALMSPQEPSSMVNLTPFTVKISLINLPAILVFFSNSSLNYFVTKSTTLYFSASLQRGAIVGL